MTPLRKKAALQADLVGLEHLLAVTPDDPLATPLMRSRVESLRSELKGLESQKSMVPEAELFFAKGPVLGSRGIDSKFAGQVLDSFQDMVSNHFAAKFHGALRKAGPRRGESDSRLLLTALPRGSFGLQVSQPRVEDFVTASQLAEAMEEVTELIGATKHDDPSFENALAKIHGRVVIPLKRFLKVLNTFGAACRVVSGMKQAELNEQEVEQAYRRVDSTEIKEDAIDLEGTFYGALVRTGRFDFEPKGQSTMTGWLGDEVSEEQAIAMERLTGKPAKAKLRVITVNTKSGRGKPAYELVSLEDLPAL